MTLLLSIIIGSFVHASDYNPSLLYEILTVEQFEQELFFDFCDKLYLNNKVTTPFGEIENRSCREIYSDWRIENPEVDFTFLTAEDTGYLTILLGDFYSAAIEVIWNGKAMFIGKSYDNREWPGSVVRDNAIITTNNGLQVFDQNEVFIESLSETFFMARCMSQWEVNHWLYGTLDMTKFRGDRIHFGFGKFKIWKNSSCLGTQFQKSTLQLLNQMNLLEINTYEYLSHTKEAWEDPGMGPESYSPFGIPFEIVVFYQEGVDQIKTPMRNIAPYTY